MKIESIQFMSNNQDITEQAKLIFSFNQSVRPDFVSEKRSDFVSQIKRKCCCGNPGKHFTFDYDSNIDNT